MENAVPQPLPEPEARNEPQCQQHRADGLKGEGPAQQKAGGSQYAAHLGQADGFPHEEPLPQPDFFAAQKIDEHSDGHKTKPAHLDQRQNDRLSEQRPMAPGVVHHQPSHTGGGGSGEQRVEKGHGPAVPAGGRQHQQAGARQNNEQKSQRDDLCRGNAPQRALSIVHVDSS